MQAFNAIIIRDIRTALRAGGAWLHGLAFFVAFLTLAAIALGGEPGVLRPLAPALIWMAVILSLLLSFDQVFASDADDGSLEQIKLSPCPLSLYVAAKACACWLLTVGPLLLALPVAALLYDLPLDRSAGLLFSVLLASPALICYGVFSASLLTSLGRSGLLLVIVCLPLVLPVLIFALASVISYENQGLLAPEFLALIGLDLIAIALAIPAATSALNTGTQ